MDSCLQPARLFGLAGFAFLLGITSCKTDPKEKPEPTPPVEKVPAVVEVSTKSMEFFAPDTIPGGWNTFVYKNLSTEPHFILLDKYPEGVSIENTIKEVAPAFEAGMSLIRDVKPVKFTVVLSYSKVETRLIASPEIFIVSS